MSVEKSSKSNASKVKDGKDKSGIASGTTSVGERPTWCQLTAKLQWWSESQKKHMPVYVTKIDDKKKSVIVTFAADRKVWKEVPFSKLGRKGCPLQPLAKENGKDSEKSKEKPEGGTATPDWWRVEKSKLLDKKEQSKREKALEEEMKQIEAKEVARKEEKKRKVLLEQERRKVAEAFEKRKREAEQQKLKEEEEWRQQLRERREKEAKEEEEREKEREAKREKKRQEKEKKRKIQEAEASTKRQAKEAEDKKKREAEEKEKAKRDAVEAAKAAESARLQAEIMRQLPTQNLLAQAQAAAWQQQALPLAMAQAQAAQAAQVAQAQVQAAQAQAVSAFAGAAVNTRNISKPLEGPFDFEDLEVVKAAKGLSELYRGQAGSNGTFAGMPSWPH